MTHEKTFDAISKLKDIEMELHRLKNALEMANRALDAQRTWVGLTDEEKEKFVVAYYPSNWDRKTAVVLMNNYEAYLKEKNT